MNHLSNTPSNRSDINLTKREKIFEKKEKKVELKFDLIDIEQVC